MSVGYFNAAEGLLDASVFSCPVIYQAELSSVFRRNWLFLGPECWLDQPGARFVSRLGEQPVLVFRAGPRVEVVCVPNALSHVTHSAPRPRVHVASGLVFACQDPEAPGFDDWMADFAPHWASILTALPGGIEVIGDVPLVAQLRCNWKVAAEAWCGWMGSNLASGRDALDDGEAGSQHGFQVANRRGAMVVVDDEVANALSGTLFPNFSFDSAASAFHVWHPDGVADCQVWTFCVAGKDESQEQRAKRLQVCSALFGPFGMDTANQQPLWRAITETSRGRLMRQAPLNLQQGIALDRVNPSQDRIAPLRSESNQRSFYDAWQRDLSLIERAERGDVPSSHQLRRESLEVIHEI